MTQKILTMPSEELAVKIWRAYGGLIPLFQVTPKELERFKIPRLRRNLGRNEAPEHPRHLPAYAFGAKFFYFPLIEARGAYVFFPSAIHHEVGHYLHDQLNSKMRKGLASPKSERYAELCELVADYGNFILDLIHPESPKRDKNFAKKKRVFDFYGKEFLPRLVRMSLNEALEENIIG